MADAQLPKNKHITQTRVIILQQHSFFSFIKLNKNIKLKKFIVTYFCLSGFLSTS